MAVTTVELPGGYIDWENHRIMLWEVFEQNKLEGEAVDEDAILKSTY